MTARAGSRSFRASKRSGHHVVAPDLPLDDPNAGFEERTRPRSMRSTTPPIRSWSSATRWASAYATLIAAGTPRLAARAPVPETWRVRRRRPARRIPSGLRSRFPADRPDGTSAWDAEAAIGAMYRRLPAETARALTQRLQPMAQPAGEFPLPGPPDIPTVLMYAAEDEFFEPAWERFMAREAARRRAGRDPRRPLPDGRGPDALAALLERVAAEHSAVVSARRPRA